MTELLSLDTILNELPDDDEMWVLQDRASGLYVTIPHERYPGRRIIHFFMKRDDAQASLDLIFEVNERLKGKDIVPIKVKLKRAILGIAADRNPDHADAFVVHSPNEVFEYLWNSPFAYSKCA